MKFDDIFQFFSKPQPEYLGKELAVCYILNTLRGGESYGSALIQTLETTPYRLSDTVLYSALRLLEGEGLITTRLEKVEGRGRPRKMYRLTSKRSKQVEELAQLWANYFKGQRGIAIAG